MSGRADEDEDLGGGMVPLNCFSLPLNSFVSISFGKNTVARVGASAIASQQSSLLASWANSDTTLHLLGFDKKVLAPEFQHELPDLDLVLMMYEGKMARGVAFYSKDRSVVSDVYLLPDSWLPPVVLKHTSIFAEAVGLHEGEEEVLPPGFPPNPHKHPTGTVRSLVARFC